MTINVGVCFVNISVAEVVGKSVHKCRCITGEQSKVGIWNTVFEVLGVKELVQSLEVGGSNPSITFKFYSNLVQPISFKSHQE